jgi:hypothetical protein
VRREVFSQVAVARPVVAQSPEDSRYGCDGVMAQLAGSGRLPRALPSESLAAPGERSDGLLRNRRAELERSSSGHDTYCKTLSAPAPGVGLGAPSSGGPPAPLKAVTWLILPVVICLSQRLSHACLSINGLYCETANGSLNQLEFI